MGSSSRPLLVMLSPMKIWIQGVALALALAFPLHAAQEAEVIPPATQVQALERPGDGRPVCGLGREFHAGRRAELRARAKQGLLLFRGLPDTRDYKKFRQDKVFWYLTGVESPNAALLMDAATGKEVLFLPKQNRGKEGWEGEIWDASDEWVKDLTGISAVLPIESLESVLKNEMQRDKTVWISTQPHVTVSGCFDRAGPHDRHQENDPFDGRTSREKMLKKNLEEKFEATVKDVTPFIDELRRVKTAPEIAALRRASQSGAIAMTEAIRSSRAGIGEWDLESLMSFIQVREGAAGPAYNAIVGAGQNSNVLHYHASSATLEGGEVVLIDYGPELDHYVTDITRTWPVDGEWTPRMTELYEAVLAAQKAGIEAVRPGVTMRDIGDIANGMLREKGFGQYIRHGVCHYVGMEVHDVGGYDKPLEPGVVITVEPGLYDTANEIGIRIEDVVLVTKDGCEILSAGVPKDRESLSALVKSRGILDYMDTPKAEPKKD
jgi:Xaa-Pro aminopeptidase